MYIRGGRINDRPAIEDPPIRFKIRPKSGKAKATNSWHKITPVRRNTRFTLNSDKLKIIFMG